MKAGICGATGYSGRELLRILLRHPEIEIVFLTSKQYAGMDIAEVFAQFRGRFHMACVPLEAEKLSKSVDVVFLSLPHTVSMSVADAFLCNGVRVVDLSADYRLKDPKEYRRWYGKDHMDVKNLEDAVYGITEIYRDKIRNQTFVSNPGCYPTGAILALYPALKHKLIDPTDIVIDSKSGVSGAGRGLSLKTHFVETNENMGAYKVGNHQHLPEIEMILSDLVGIELFVDFTPHLVPLERGILTTAYARLKQTCVVEDVMRAYGETYSGEHFIRILPQGQYPQTGTVEGSNYCDIGVSYHEQTGRLIVLSAIDNLIKGASGQAVQNMNLMCGFPEEAGLIE